MINYLKREIERRKSKHSLNEYGFQIKSFNLPSEGKVEYAQWLHPYEQPKIISQSMVDFFKSHSNEGSLVLDIGAHTGDTAVPMAVAIGAKGTVLAFEPNPYVFKILKQNAGLNKDKTNIIPLNFAATDVDGEFEFNYSDASFCNGGFFQRIQNKRHGHKFTLKVQGKNLENYLNGNFSSVLDTLSLIKVDAEGYDKEILKSLTPVLKKFRPRIISECNKNLTVEERNELFEVINSLGYDLYKLDGFVDGSELSFITNASDMSKWKHFDLIGIPR